jgi:hypothetical protein
VASQPAYTKNGKNLIKIRLPSSLSGAQRFLHFWLRAGQENPQKDPIRPFPRKPFVRIVA